jgi:membrane protein DedA with SNARE-associated domain
MSIQDFIEAYGYWAVLVGTFLEGETILVLGGFAANRGYLDLPWVIVAAFLGSFSGDQLYFYLGRRYGRRIIAKRLSWQISAEKVYRLLERHQTLLILTFRFMYGLRNVTPFALGASRVPKLKFFILNAIGAIIWAITLAWGGYLFGHAFELFFDDFKRYELYVLVGLVLLGLIVWLTTLIRHRRKALSKN